MSNSMRNLMLSCPGALMLAVFSIWVVFAEQPTFQNAPGNRSAAHLGVTSNLNGLSGYICEDIAIITGESARVAILLRKRARAAEEAARIEKLFSPSFSHKGRKSWYFKKEVGSASITLIVGAGRREIESVEDSAIADEDLGITKVFITISASAPTNSGTSDFRFGAI